MTTHESWRLLVSGVTAIATVVLALVGILGYYLKVPEVFSPPSEPRSLTGEVRDGDVDLRWVAPESLTRTVARYRVLRRITGQSQPGDFTTVAEVDMDTTGYRDDVNWGNGIQFVYRVVAVGLNGRTSAWSRYINCTSTGGCVDNAGNPAGHDTQP